MYAAYNGVLILIIAFIIVINDNNNVSHIQVFFSEALAHLIVSLRYTKSVFVCCIHSARTIHI